MKRRGLFLYTLYEVQVQGNRYWVDNEVLKTEWNETHKGRQGREQKQNAADQDQSLPGRIHRLLDHLDHFIDEKCDDGGIEQENQES